MQITSRLKAYFMLLIAAIIWGIAGPVIKLTLNGVSPVEFLTYRFFISALLAFPFLISQFHLIKRSPILILIYAFLNSTATLGLLFLGADKTTLLDMSLISVFGPVLMILMGYYFLNDRITKRERFGSVVAFIGAIIIALEPISNNGDGSTRLLGNLLIFGSLVAAALSGYLVKRLMKDGIPPGFLMNISFFVGFISLLPIFILTPHSSPFSLGIPFQLGILYMALFSGTLAYYLYNKAQRTIELSESALFSYIHPGISAGFALFLLGEKLTPQMILGSVIAIIGVAIAEIKKRRYN